MAIKSLKVDGRKVFYDSSKTSPALKAILRENQRGKQLYPNATQDSPGFMSEEDKAKLDNLPELTWGNVSGKPLENMTFHEGDTHRIGWITIELNED